MSTNSPMMACGHAANGYMTRLGDVDFNEPVPVCVICGRWDVADTDLDLIGWVDRCSYLWPQVSERAAIEDQSCVLWVPPRARARQVLLRMLRMLRMGLMHTSIKKG